ncbi:MAG TPA: YraN family protein [Chthonomonadaceae bacterium]|nr:YraN family protein [Chthonomonadaceae bacterium]
MADNLKQIGADGERVARAHLERLGWSIVALNYRCPGGEMDIIAEAPADDGTTLVFVEVKTRRGGGHGSPIEAVDPRKIERLRAIARSFLSARDAGGEEPACRFDVAEVRQGGDGLFAVQLHSGIQVDSARAET